MVQILVMRPAPSFVFAVLTCCIGNAFAQSAGDLQKQAIARIDAFVENFRRTGDRTALLPDLATASQGLNISNRQLAAQGNWSAVSLGLIKQGSIYRMQGQWAPAINLYTEALNTARRAQDTARQSDDLAWRALAKSSARNVGEALADAQEAVRLGEKINDKDTFARALDVLGGAQLAEGDLAGAAQTLTREVDVASQAPDPMSLYYAYASRSDVYLRPAKNASTGRLSMYAMERSTRRGQIYNEH
jgi:tetratricopeptide (TPR) repeat protein